MRILTSNAFWLFSSLSAAQSALAYSFQCPQAHITLLTSVGVQGVTVPASVGHGLCGIKSQMEM